MLAGEQAALAKVAYCIEPLARPDCNFVNTLAEAAEIVRRIGNPSLRIMVDTLAASLMEPEPVADAIRRWMPSGLVAHVQFNDRNRRGPGQGDDRFAPVVKALRETGYRGWIAMEPFVYEPDGPTCAARMIGYVAGLLESERMKVKLEDVERYRAAREDAARLPLRRDHRHRRHAGRDQGPHLAARRPDEPRRGGRSAGRQVVREEPGNSPTSRISTSSARRSTLPSNSIAHRVSTSPSTCSPAPMPSSTSAARRLGLNPLVAAYGPALLDRAILDALGRATGQSFATMIARNVAGHPHDVADAGHRGRRSRRRSCPASCRHQASTCATRSAWSIR